MKQKIHRGGRGAVVNFFFRGIGIVVALRPTVHEGTRRSPDKGTLIAESV